MKRVLKWVVPVDDQPHQIGAGPILHVGHQGSVDEVVVWTEEHVGVQADPRYAQVFGTGHPYPDRHTAMGSVQAPQGLVWHLVVLS